MKKIAALNNKETNPAETDQTLSENQKPEPLWIERLDACLTDEFRFQLNEIMTTTYWSDVNHGAWNDPIKFFEYLDTQVKIIYQLKGNPSSLGSHFNSINPSLQPYPHSGSASKAARENLPVFRQQVFLINALHIIIKKRFENDQSLRLALSVLKKLLDQKIIETLRIFGAMVENPEWDYLANRVGRYGILKDKAAAIYNFLSEIIEKNNLKSHSDGRDTHLFMTEQLTIPYQVIIQNNNNRISNAFGGDRNLESLCANLYYEYYRLTALASLEGLQQNDSTSETQLQIQETDELPEEKKENSKHFIPRDEKQVFLALEIILRLLRSTGNQTDKGKLMSFLSGYSAETMRQYFSKSENWTDKRENLQYIQGLCKELGLLSVRKEIEKEITELR